MQLHLHLVNELMGYVKSYMHLLVTQWDLLLKNKTLRIQRTWWTARDVLLILACFWSSICVSKICPMPPPPLWSSV